MTTQRTGSNQGAGEVPPATGGVITRQALKDGSLLAYWRATASPDCPVNTDEEIEASLAQALSERPGDGDVWVFAFGSLIWNPTFEFVEQRVATAQGWHRRFCVWIRRGRASPQVPGLTLGLDHGGSCSGIAFRIERLQVKEELLMLWRREMASGVYEARWLDLELEGTVERSVKAVTFVANRAHERFTDSLTDAEIAETLVKAHGPFGTSLEYFTNTIGHLEAMGLSDAGLDRIRRCIAESIKSSETRKGG